ncbi:MULTISPECIES: sensor histidine kinase [Aquincola]|uniref:sensor histidine kinase n=1 Tax=Aquincola TaxID=391952 RepID=UPI000A606267|nr:MULTISPECIES: sensor histidine kinase [Aquincola]MCR5864728.1 sensor histidine kinase [Aquincola sp. J276]
MKPPSMQDLRRRLGRLSVRSRLLWGLLLPMLALVALNTGSLYRQALRSVNTAYDRTLLASAKSLGELLAVEQVGGRLRITSTVQYSALEAFESDNRSSLFYKVTGFDGEVVAGYPDLPPWRGTLPAKGPYAALVEFYDDHYQGEPVRVAVLLQPVASRDGMGVATIQVAETLELRETLARQILLDTVWRQAALLAVLALVVVLVVQSATRPVRELSTLLRQRREGDLTPVDAQGAPKELRPLMDATNEVMQRLQQLLDHQKRFVRDASHQLRTPLAVLKAQVQSAQRGDVPPAQALQEIATTVQGATDLANQMLALAKLEQLRQQGAPEPQDWAPIVRAVSLDIAPLTADRGLDFSLEAAPAWVRAHPWALRELTRNLLHNAIKHGPPGSALEVRLGVDGGQAVLTVADEGPGISEPLRRRLFQPFSAGEAGSGSGLGLAICREIVEPLGGQIALENRRGDDRRPPGLDAVVRLPLAENAAR